MPQSTTSLADPHAPECRTKRLRRSTWHQLLAAVEARRETTSGLADLLGTTDAQLQTWREAVAPMPTGIQRRLAILASTRYAPHDPAIRRLASNALAQVEAREASEARGPVHIMAVPGSLR